MRFTRRKLVPFVLVLAGCAGAPAPQQGTFGTAQLPVVAPAFQAEYGRAVEALTDKRYDDAEAAFTALAASEPRYSGALVNLGILYVRTGRYDDAITALDEAVARNPDNASAHNQRGIALRNAGRFSDAEAAYEAALAIDPDYALAHYNLGVLKDLYYLDPAAAVAHFEHYAALTGGEDEEVQVWIAELRRRAESARQARNTP